jgi:hypothetical protein
VTLNQKLRHPANDPARRDAWRKSISEASIGKKIRRKESLEEAFWSRVNKGSDSGCWEWTKGTAQGYGVFTYAHIKYKCHRSGGTMKPFEHDFFLCECGSVEHQFVVTIDPEDEHQECWIEIHLNPLYGFWKRAWLAIRYVFGYHCKYGNFNTVIIDGNNAVRLRDLMQKFLDLKKQ